MKAIRLLTTAVTFLLTALASAGPAILYVSESGEKRIAIYRRDARTGALTALKTYECGRSPAWVTGVKF